MQTNTATLIQMLVGEQGNPESVKQSAIGTMTSGITLLYKVPPVSSREFFAYMGSRFHVPGTPTPAYAATGGFGFNTIGGPVLTIWVAMRNLAYFVFAAIFIIVGVMILIRSKIDPKTTINIQNALPKIILALLLVTFSYAIAGFLIDFMYVALALIITLFESINITLVSTAGSNTADLGKNILAHNLFWGFFSTTPTGTSVGGSMWDAIGSAGQAVSTLLYNFINGISGQQIGGPVGGMLTGIAGGIAALVIAVAILFALFKTWISLLSAYANILLGIVLSPLHLMLDAIPGQNQFNEWIRNMLGNLLAFPAVLFMILIGITMAKSSNGTTGASPIGFSPPLIGASSDAAMQAIVGIAIILTIPKAVEMVQETLKSPKQKFGNALGEAIGSSVQLGQSAKKFGEEQSGLTYAKQRYQKDEAGSKWYTSGQNMTGGWRDFFVKH